MSKEPSATAQVVTAVKASQQFARLRVAETEETSSSGEELYTDGSSDEDNCRCKHSPTKDASATLQVMLARSKGRLGVKPSSRSSGESPEEAPREDEDDGRCGQSASTAGRSTGSLAASEGDDSLDDDDDDDEISWKVIREEEIMMENEMVAIEDYRKAYPKICDSVDSIFNQYYQQLINLEQMDNEIFVEGKEKIKGDLMNSVQFLDTTMDKIMKKLEQIKKKTQQIQLKNRLKLKEIVKSSPTPSAKLAENTKKFFDLYTGKGLSNTPDNCGTETAKDIVVLCN